MNQRPEWQRHMEVWPLDGKLGAGPGSGLGTDAFAGNNLGKREFTPKKEYESAGIPTTTLARQKSDLIVVRVTWRKEREQRLSDVLAGDLGDLFTRRHLE